MENFRTFLKDVFMKTIKKLSDIKSLRILIS